MEVVWSKGTYKLPSNRAGRMGKETGELIDIGLIFISSPYNENHQS